MSPISFTLVKPFKNEIKWYIKRLSVLPGYAPYAMFTDNCFLIAGMYKVISVFPAWWGRGIREFQNGGEKREQNWRIFRQQNSRKIPICLFVWEMRLINLKLVKHYQYSTRKKCSHKKSVWELRESRWHFFFSNWSLFLLGQGKVEFNGETD